MEVIRKPCEREMFVSWFHFKQRISTKEEKEKYQYVGVRSSKKALKIYCPSIRGAKISS